MFFGDKDGDSIGIENDLVILENPEAGSIEGNAIDGWTFTAAENYNGSATFTYSVTDGKSSVNATTTLEITSINDVPIAKLDGTKLRTYTEDTDEIITITLNTEWCKRRRITEKHATNRKSKCRSRQHKSLG